MFLSIFLFFSSLFLLFLFGVHYIFILLLLEILLFSVYLGCSGSMSPVYGIPLLFIYLLTMVCMGGFSISLLVCVSRLFGRDFWYFRHIF